jgi:subtilisin family serine protease
VDRLHSSGVTGAGVKIAVIDVDFKGYGDAMKSGELPPDTNVKNFSCALRDTTAHGTAVAELVHDVAPGASLDLLCIDSELSLAKAVDWVINEHDIHVISHSITWLGGGRGDGVNYIGLSPDATAAKAFGAGILWVNAAGNYAQSHWSGAFSHRGSSVFQDFGGGDTGNQFSIPAKTTGCANLTWDDWPVSDQDFDLYVSQVGTGTVLASSRNIQRPGELGTPAEEACYKNTSASTVFAYASIQSLPPATTSRFDLFVTTGTLEHSVPQGSVAEPAESPFVLGVGAVCWLGNGIRPYSSQGPTIDGRIKPDLVAYDGVSTSTFGLSSNCNGGFLGTSAATPEVAGAAALLLQQQPGLAGQPGQLMAALEGRTAHLGLSGRNNLFGSGRLCFSACAPPPPPPPPPGPPPPPPPPPPSQAQLKLVLVRFATTPVRSKAGKPFAAAIAVARKDTGARVRTGKVLCSARLGGRSRVHLVRAGFRGGLARCSWRIPAGSRHKLLRGSVGLSYHGATIRRSFTRRIT